MWLVVGVAAVTLGCLVSRATCQVESGSGGSGGDTAAAAGTLEDADLKEALLIVDILKAEYARLFREDAEVKESGAASSTAPPSPPRTSPPPASQPTRQQHETDITVEASFPSVQINNERRSSSVDGIQEVPYFRRAENKGAGPEVLDKDFPNSVPASGPQYSLPVAVNNTTTAAPPLKLATQEDVIMSQVASVLMKEIENADEYLNSLTPKGSAITKTPMKSPKRTREPLGYLLKSTRLEAPFPVNHPFCFTNPNNPFCRTYI